MTKPSTFADAYKLLDQATADFSAPDLGTLVTNEIAQIKSNLLSELVAGAAGVKGGANEIGLLAKDLGALGVGHAEEVIGQVSDNVKANPLLYAGGAALGALALGFLLSRPSKPKVKPAENLVDEDLLPGSGVKSEVENDTMVSESEWMHTDAQAEGVLP